MPRNHALRLEIVCEVMDVLSTYSLFPLFESHFSTSVFITGQSHYSQLIKLISSKYIDLRLKDYGKTYLLKHHFQSKPSHRMQLNKLVLFEGR